MEKWERLLDNYMQKERSKSVLKMQAEGPTQEQAFKAVLAEEKGDREAASQHWQAVKELEGEDSSWARVADKHLEEWQALDQIDKQFQQVYQSMHNSGKEPELTDERQREAFLAWRMENSDVGDKGLAKGLFKSMQEERAKEPGLRRRWYLYAAWHARQLDKEDPPKKDDLKDKIHKQLETRRDQLKKNQIRRAVAKIDCLDVLALYGEDKSMSQVVEEANNLLEDPLLK